LDLDANGDLAGIEKLKPGRLTIHQFKKIAKDYNAPALKHVRIDKLQEAFA
jgi:hypothetical protein